MAEAPFDRRPDQRKPFVCIALSCNSSRMTSTVGQRDLSSTVEIIN